MNPWYNLEGKSMDTKLTSPLEWKVLKECGALTWRLDYWTSWQLFSHSHFSLFPIRYFLTSFHNWIALALCSDTADHIRTTLPVRTTYGFFPCKVWYCQYIKRSKDDSLVVDSCQAASLVSPKATLGRAIGPASWTVWMDLRQPFFWLRISRALLLSRFSVRSCVMPIISRKVLLKLSVQNAQNKKQLHHNPAEHFFATQCYDLPWWVNTFCLNVSQSKPPHLEWLRTETETLNQSAIQTDTEDT